MVLINWEKLGNRSDNQAQDRNRKLNMSFTNMVTNRTDVAKAFKLEFLVLNGLIT